MRINTNLSAMTALNNSTKTTALASNSMEKLSSGLRINSASDDAAGLAISEKMRSQIRGLDQASKNAQDGISVVQTAEGAMEEIGNITQRMRELTVQASSETNSTEDRAKIGEELSQLYDEIDRIANSTEFNKTSLLNGGATTTSKVTDMTIGGGAGSASTVDDFKLYGDFTNADSVEVVYGDNAGTKTITLNIKKADGTVLASGTSDLVDTNLTDGIEEKVTIKLEGDKGEIKLTLKEAASQIDEADPAKNKFTAGTIVVDPAAPGIDKVELNLQVGANNNSHQNLKLNINNVTNQGLGLDGQAKTTIEAMKGGTATTDEIKDLIDNLDTALETVSTNRANLGAMQNRLETAQSNLTTSSENLTAAESRIRDVDVADEMMNLSKLNLINQAAQAMMTQAKSQPEGVMQLLR